MRATIDTTIGPLGIEQNDRGLTRVILRARGEISGDGGAWGERLRAYLVGEDVPFDDLPIDNSTWSPFAARVYDAARRIPRGKTVTYAELAREIDTVNARAVGVALGKNPIPIVVPCHRIVGKDDAGGFSAPGGTSTKAQLLAIEGGALDDESHRVARRHLTRVDKDLAPFVKRIECTLPVRPNGNLFRTIVRAIAGQQLSTKAAATIFARLETALGVSARWPADAPNRVLATDDATLRGVGLSNAKAASLRDLATRVASGQLDLDRITRLPDEAVIEALCEVRGIGRWTAEMLLIFDLGRPDVLPVDDLGIRKGAQKVWGLRALPEAPAIIKRAEAWRPFRSIGSWYLWRALEAFLFVMLLCGCQGESVATQAADSGTSDASLCAIKNNLLTNGDFQSGVSPWANNSFTIEPTTGPCGKALRLTAKSITSGLGQNLVGPFKKGTRYRLRAFIRIVNVQSDANPVVIARFFHGAGAAETYTQTLVAQPLSSKEWQQIEIAAPLERDEDNLGVSALMDGVVGDVFEIGAIVLTVE